MHCLTYIRELCYTYLRSVPQVSLRVKKGCRSHMEYLKTVVFLKKIVSSVGKVFVGNRFQTERENKNEKI